MQPKPSHVYHKRHTILKEIDMRGRIASDQRCPLCNAHYRDTGKSLACPVHPEQRASKFKVKYGPLCRRTDSYREAFTILSLFRGRASEGTFNAKEYMVSRPLALSTMSEKFLEARAGEARDGTIKSWEYSLSLAEEFYGDILISGIQYGELEDYAKWLLTRVAKTTRYVAFQALKTLLRWARKRGGIQVLPEFPTASYTREIPKVLTKDTQAAVLKHIFEQRWRRDPRTCVSLHLLCTYPKIRPRELWDVKEKHIDLREGFVVIEKPKESDEPKRVKLTPEDVEMIRSLPRGFPDLYFLRNTHGKRYRINHMGTVWREACKELGIEVTSLYRGTKHTTITALARQYPTRLLETATGVSERNLKHYAALREEDCVDIYRAARPKMEVV